MTFRTYSLIAAVSLMVAGPSVAEKNGIAASVNGRPVLDSQVEELYKASELDLMRRFPDPKEREAERAKLRSRVLDQLIDQELVLKEFEPFRGAFDSKVNAYAEETIRTQFVDKMFEGKRENFLKELTSSGMSYKKFFEQQRKNVIAEMMRGQFAAVKETYITEEEKAAYLKAHAAEYREGDRLKLWSVTIPGDDLGSTPAGQQALVREIRTKLASGDDFATIARTYSKDSKAEKGGSWDWVEEKDLAPAMWRVVVKLDDRRVSEVITFGGNYYIFWIEGRQAGKMKPKEEVDAEIERRIMIERKRVATEKWMEKLRKKATIIRY